MLEKKALVSVKINDIASKRWSCRAFDPEKPVKRQSIKSLCEAGRWAPSCFGDEPWRFLVFDKNNDKALWEKAFNSLDPWNQGWAKNAPVLLAVFADDKFRKTGKPNRWGQFDAGAACMNIYLQAVDIGLMSHPMGGFDADKLKKDFDVPDNFDAMAMIAVGYQAEPDSLDEEYYDSEVAERFRRPIGTTFFDGEWEKPIA